MPRSVQYSNLSLSEYGEECMCALEWGIPLDVWWNMPRLLRGAHMATITVKRLIMSYGADND